MAHAQAGLFLMFVLDGIVIGIIFDFFRILRKSFLTGNIVTAIEDIIFWILTGGIILYTVFVFNNGIIRGYMFLGVFCGILIYLVTFSKFFIKINVTIISFIKKIIFGILMPMQWIFRVAKKVIFKPISMIFINTKIILKKYMIKTNKITKKSKN